MRNSTTSPSAMFVLSTISSKIAPVARFVVDASVCSVPMLAACVPDAGLGESCVVIPVMGLRSPNYGPPAGIIPRSFGEGGSSPNYGPPAGVIPRSLGEGGSWALGPLDQSTGRRRQHEIAGAQAHRRIQIDHA